MESLHEIAEQHEPKHKREHHQAYIDMGEDEMPSLIGTMKKAKFFQK